MSESIERIIAFLEPAMRSGRIGRICRGVEKEGLRVDPEGYVSQVPHQSALGSKLTHPHITTDYSEALLEYVTPVFCKPQAAIDFLTDLHRYTYRYIGDELVWPVSMPSRLKGNDSIPIADFGTSNQGRMKHVYRRGLDVRYGRIMQAIAGIHYNVSMPDNLWYALASAESGQTSIKTLSDEELRRYRSEGYFRLIRNFRRHSWILMYLFGASPAVDTSFFDGREPPDFETVGTHTLIARYASSLRMSDMGYQNKVQNQLNVGYDNLDTYVKTLRYAISIPWEGYERFGGAGHDDKWQQLNANILQIENEFYSDIRPKRVARHHQTPIQALEAEGVEYIEVRCLDINPLLPMGIDETEMRFIDVFLLFCLLATPDTISDNEEKALKTNRTRVVTEGRNPDLKLIDGQGKERPLSEVGEELFHEMSKVAALLDVIEEGTPNSDSLSALLPRLAHPEQTPAGQVYKALVEKNEDFSDWALAQARHHAQELAAQPIPKAREALLEQLSETSRIQQADIEKDDTLSFEEFVARYFAKADEVAKTD